MISERAVAAANQIDEMFMHQPITEKMMPMLVRVAVGIGMDMEYSNLERVMLRRKIDEIVSLYHKRMGTLNIWDGVPDA